MKKKDRLKIILGIFLFSLFLAYFFFKSSNISPKKINFNNFSSQEKEYSISPNQSLTPKIQVKYPYVSIPPSNQKKYFFVNLLEHLDLKQKKYNELFFSSKRLSELLKWGSKIPIEHISNTLTEQIYRSQYKVPTTQKLINWWRKNKPKTFEFKKYKNYNSWETVLARYYLLFNKAIDKSKRNNLEIKQISTYLKSHQQYLASVIFNSSKSNQNKLYLLSLSNNIFNSLDEKLAKYIKTPQKDKTQYSLEKIIKEKEWGIYQLIIDLETYPYLKKAPITLEINNKAYYPRYNNQSNSLVFNNLKINYQTIKNQNITLNYPQKNLLKQGYWTKIINYQTKKPNYKYIFSSFSSLKKGQYFLTFSYQLKKPISFQLNLMYKENLKNNQKKTKNNPKNKKLYSQQPKTQINSQNLISQTIYPFLKNKTYSIQLTIPDTDKKYFKSELIINSTNKITRKQLLYLKPHLYRLYQPEIQLVKTSSFSDIKPQIDSKKTADNQYLVTVKNTSLDQDNYLSSSLGFGWKKIWQKQLNPTTYRFKITFWPKKLINNLLVLSILIFIILIADLFYKLKNPHKPSFIDTLCSKKTLKKIKKYLFLPFRFIWKIIKNLSSQYKYILFSLTVTGIVFDIFFFHRNSDLLLLTLTFSWVLTIIGFKTESRTSFVFALFWLILIPFFLIFKKEFIAEKMAIWTYMMLVVGTIQSIIELKLELTHLNSPQEFVQTLRKSKLNLFLISSGTFLFYKVRLYSLKLKNKTIYLIKYKIIYLIKKYFYPKPSTFIERIVYLLKLISIIIFIPLVLLTSYFVINTANKEINKIKKVFHRKALNPIIEKVEPKFVYKSTKVILFGKDFGWNQEDKLRIYTTQGTIRPDLVNDTKIIFTVPLHWKEGEINIWLGKLVGWEGKTIQAISNTVRIKLIPISSRFTPEDDLFFEQLKKLDPETRAINGYN